MKKWLLPQQGEFYKANLHAHTIQSDGQNTPEEVKDIFKSKGYSVVAYTDHNVFLDRSNLCDETFIALNGVELDINGRDFGSGWLIMETCHINFIAKSQDNLKFPYYNEKYFYANASKYSSLMKKDESTYNYERVYTPQCISEMLLGGQQRGFYTVYNHPTGSLERYPIYSKYENMNAMEIYNGVWSNDTHVYDDMISLGKKIHCVGGDDSHSLDGSGFSWTMIKAERLGYREIMQALEDGNFYASQGPSIYELYVEDGVINIKTSDAQAIFFSTASRSPGRIYKRAQEGKYLNQATFKVLLESKYVRIIVVGPNGKTPSTNVYYVEDLLKS